MKNFYLLATICRGSIFSFFLLTAITVNAQESMRANLYVVDASGATLVDGNLTNYNNIYSNDVDINDAWKMTNPGMNFGILRSSTNLVVERRRIYDVSDTTFFRMWNMPQYHYRIKFMLKNLDHPGMFGFVKDNYTNTETAIALNDTTYYDFFVNANPSSGSEMRFKLIYGPIISGTGPVNVNITGIQAHRKGQDIFVEWNVVNEENIESYTIEHSGDARNFNSLKQVSAINTPIAKSYNYVDARASESTNYYRIKATSIGGKIQYSPIAKINAVTQKAEITVYPNPVTNKITQLQFSNQPAGKYNLVLLHSNGVQQPLTTLQIDEGESSRSLHLPQTIVPGVYQLQIIGPDKVRTVRSIQVL